MKTDMVSVLNPGNIPVTDTDYCQWLMYKGKTDINVIETKYEYLRERFEFVRGVDKLDVETQKNLKAIESMYFDFVNWGKL